MMTNQLPERITNPDADRPTSEEQPTGSYADMGSVGLRFFDMHPALEPTTLLMDSAEKLARAQAVADELGLTYGRVMDEDTTTSVYSDKGREYAFRKGTTTEERNQIARDHGNTARRAARQGGGLIQIYASDLGEFWSKLEGSDG